VAGPPGVTRTTSRLQRHRCPTWTSGRRRGSEHRGRLAGVRPHHTGLPAARAQLADPAPDALGQTDIRTATIGYVRFVLGAKNIKIQTTSYFLNQSRGRFLEYQLNSELTDKSRLNLAEI